jgi:prepilin-type N-terminal cleavage/methylation domain-containing protein
MRKRFKAFTLIELLVVIAIIALLISILLPSLSRARELSKRLVCGSNTKGIGTSAKIYSNENQEKWMVPGHKKKQDATGIAYLCSGDRPEDIACVGYERWNESKSETANDPAAGSTALSVTRAYWMMVRSGDITVKQFICPSSSDDEDQTENLDLYYDFTDYGNISYGYLVPFGPRDTQPREGMDNRQVLAADKGPYYKKVVLDPMTRGPNNQPLEVDSSPKDWRPFNSSNHGGQSNGEGQNALYADGHSSFLRTPLGGIDNDNIYTLMRDEWGVQVYGRIHGDSPHDSAAENPYPGKEAFGQGNNTYASTDSLIYP